MRSRTYEITFVGQAGSALHAEFDDCEIIVGPDTTTLCAQVPDQGALWGLVERIIGFGLEVTHLHLVATPAPPGGAPDAAPAPAGETAGASS